jgi:hypothetical protein
MEDKSRKVAKAQKEFGSLSVQTEVWWRKKKGGRSEGKKLYIPELATTPRRSADNATAGNGSILRWTRSSFITTYDRKLAERSVR